MLTLLRIISSAVIRVGLFLSLVWAACAALAGRFYSWTPLGRTRVGAIALHTVSEGLRMRIALVFLALMGLCVLGLPFTIRGDSSLTGAVQSYMSYSFSAVGFLLGILTIFQARSISDELVHKQIMTLMTKPVSRWQYVLGKWLGISMFNFAFLVFAGVTVYGMVHYLQATHPPIEDRFSSTNVGAGDVQTAFNSDERRLQTEVLVARHSTRMILPDFTGPAERELQQRLETGFYDNAVTFNMEEERERLRDKEEARWRNVPPLDTRRLDFANVLCDRSPDSEIQLRYKAEISGYVPDEILRALWVFGDREKNARIYTAFTRHMDGRFHTIRVPADCVAEDYTLSVLFVNRNPYSDPRYFQETEAPFPCGVRFSPAKPIEVLFVVGSFEGNLVRLLTLMMCKLMFLAAVGVLATCVFSFPVACLAAFMVFTLAGTRSFIDQSFDQASDDHATVMSALSEVVKGISAGEMTAVSKGLQAFVVESAEEVLRGLFYVIPDFSYYDAVETLVDGRNVSLVWVLQGIGELAVLQTTLVLGLAMILFHRREVAEVSV